MGAPGLSAQRTLLIDADIFVYKAACAVQRSYDWDDDGDPAILTDISEAREKFTRLLHDARTGFRKADFIICLSDSEPSFRKDFWPTYKGQRGSRPLAYTALREWILEQSWRTYLRPRLEADDILGILATHPTIVEGERIIYSGDKDLRQIPGLHLDVNSGDLIRVSPEAGEALFWTQMLTGDVVDNYPGCPGIGPVKAAKILAEADRWGAVVAAYEKAGKTAEDALIQARCARILRAGEYNFKTKEPILWNPPAATTATKTHSPLAAPTAKRASATDLQAAR